MMGKKAVRKVIASLGRAPKPIQITKTGARAALGIASDIERRGYNPLASRSEWAIIVASVMPTTAATEKPSNTP